MQRGCKAEPPGVKAARGTLQPYRDGDRTEIVVPGDARLSDAARDRRLAGRDRAGPKPVFRGFRTVINMPPRCRSGRGRLG